MVEKISKGGFDASGLKKEVSGINQQKENPNEYSPEEVMILKSLGHEVPPSVPSNGSSTTKIKK